MSNSRVLQKIASALCLALLIVAPLAVGSNRQPAFSIVVGLGALVGVLGIGVLALQSGSGYRALQASAPLRYMFWIPLIQLIPWPYALRTRIDPAASILLTHGHPATPLSWYPWSLSPMATTRALVLAGAAFLVFFATFLVVRRNAVRGELLARAVAVVGLIGIGIAIAHPIASIEQVYGMWGPVRKGLMGPFVNPNHNAQFFEFAAFCALASASVGNTRLHRSGWLGGAALLAMAALASGSRGAILGLFAGGAVILWGTLRRNDLEISKAKWFAGVVAVLGVILAGGIWGLGTGSLWQDLTAAPRGNPAEKWHIWRQALEVLRNHPLGIGAGAFEDVFPRYRALPSLLRHTSVENVPLSWLIEYGVPATLVLGSSIWVFGRRAIRTGVSTDYHNGLWAAVIAVAAHNVVDFGWDLPGIRLPFSIILAVVTASSTVVNSGKKTKRTDQGGAYRPWAYLHLAPAVFAIAAGVVALHWDEGPEAARNLQGKKPDKRAGYVLALERLYPTDYFLPYRRSGLVPTMDSQGRSPKLSALNRAMYLCPTCPGLYAQAARVVWALGNRRQAVGLWTHAIDLESLYIARFFDDFSRLGGKEGDAIWCKPKRPAAAVNIAEYLLHRNWLIAARSAIDWSAATGASDLDLYRLNLDLLVRGQRWSEAEKYWGALNPALKRNGGLVGVYLAVLLHNDAPAMALDLIAKVPDGDPAWVALARRRIEMVSQFGLWELLAAADDALRIKHGRGLEERVRDSQILAEAYARWGNRPREMRERRWAAQLAANRPDLWLALAVAAEDHKMFGEALSAYRAVLRLQPEHRQAQEGVVRLGKTRQYP